MRFFILLASVVLLSACQSHISPRVAPESLLNASSEHVAFSLTDANSVDSVFAWIKDDKPTEAELVCAKNKKTCMNVKNELSDRSIPTKLKKSVDGTNSVSLIYHRVTARNCSVRGFGCSVSVNALQMVPDYSHFTRPPLSEKQSAKRAVNAYDRYMGR